MYPRRNRVPSKLRGRAKNNAEAHRTGRVRPVPPSHRITTKREMRALGVHQLTGRDSDGRTVLHILARKGKTSLSLAVLRHLPPSIRAQFLNARTNATAPGCGHRTALHIAALYGHGKLYRALLRVITFLSSSSSTTHCPFNPNLTHIFTYLGWSRSHPRRPNE